MDRSKISVGHSVFYTRAIALPFTIAKYPLGYLVLHIEGTSGNSSSLHCTLVKRSWLHRESKITILAFMSLFEEICAQNCLEEVENGLE